MNSKSAVATAASMAANSFSSASDGEVFARADLIICHDNEVPAYIEPALDRLYGSLFSSFARFRVYGGVENASTYVVRRNDEIVTIFLFRVENSQVRVLNEWMAVDDAGLRRFAEYVFGRFKSANVISFNAVEGRIERPGFPFQAYSCTEDSVVDLPETPDDYLNGFGKSMRRNLKYYLNRLKRDFPSFDYRVYDKNQASEEHVRGIVGFNRLRFANKKKVSAITADDEERILRMVRECGIVGVATIDGRICAGSITYRIGDRCYSWIKAHDPAYDDCRFGMILSYLMICECISRGAKTFHFLWGRQAQKAQLQGVNHDKMHLTIYRSRGHQVRHAGVVLNNLRKHAIREARLWVKEREQKSDLLSRLVLVLVYGLRELKRGAVKSAEASGD